MEQRHSTLTELLRYIEDNGGEERITLHEITHMLGERGFGPIILVLSVILISPIGGIPGVPDVIATAIILVGGQAVYGRATLWLPRWLGRFSFSAVRYAYTRQRMEPWTRALDQFFRPRLSIFVNTFAMRGIALMCVVLALSVYILGFIPFAAAVPAAAMIVLSLGLTVRDGLLVLIGYTVAVLTASGIALYFL
jgi:hypothetical protein